MWEDLEPSTISYPEEERILHSRYKEAMKTKDRNVIHQAKKALVRLYVYHGEHFKMSSSPDFRSAKYYLKKALQLEANHPLANYRYAHILFREKEYEMAAYHFRKALDGSEEEGLNDSQALIAQMLLVNCGLLMAKDALKEVQFMMDNDFLDYDPDLVENYYEKMLVQSEEMLEQHMYCKLTPEGVHPISKDEFVEYQERVRDNEVLLYVEDGYHIKFKQKWYALEHRAFCVFWVLIRSNDFIGAQEIASVLGESPAELELRNDHIRQLISRMSRNLLFWDEVIETKEVGNRSLRRRKEDITYTLLCHSSVVLP